MLLLSAFNAAPREGHVNALYNIFSYLKTFKLPHCIYPTLPNHDVGRIELKGWEESYEVADEPVPSNALEPWATNEDDLSC